MNPSAKTVIGRALVIFGCCALAFAGLQALLVWGENQASWPMQMSTLRRNLEFGVEFSSAIGIGAIALGVWLRRLNGTSKAVGTIVLGMRLTRVKPGPDAGSSPKKLP